MKFFYIFLLMNCVCFVFTTKTLASEVELVKSKLLESTLDVIEDEKSSATKRLKLFTQKRDKAYLLLKQSGEKKSSLIQKSITLEGIFANNDKKLTETQELLTERKAHLTAFFETLELISGEVRSDFQRSLISAQFDSRVDFLDQLLSDLDNDYSIVSFSKIERFWKEISREIEESGKIVSFDTDVILRTGRKERQTVTRIGAFNATWNRKYLILEPGSLTLSELPRQPEKRYRKDLPNPSDLETDMIPLTIDPTRGQLLTLMVQHPNLADRLNQGGMIGYLIVTLGIISVLITLHRYLILSKIEKMISLESDTIDEFNGNPLSRLISIANNSSADAPEVLEVKLEEGLTSETSRLFSKVNYIKFIAIISPLLGLLGTVSGMIITFQSISMFGTNDPNLMAGGISQALVTTVLGLCVAIPSLLFFTLLSEKAKGISGILEQNVFALIIERQKPM